MNVLGVHAVGLQYKASNPSIAPIGCAADLPHDPDELGKYAQDIRFNGKTEKVIFHVRFLSSTPVVHLKRAYYPEIRQVGRASMRLLQKFGIWFKAQQCSETRVAKIGWLLMSHPTDGVDNVKAQLQECWREKLSYFPRNSGRWYAGDLTLHHRKTKK